MRGIWAICLLWLLALPVAADTLRIATFDSELSRDGPGLLLRDIRRGDAQAQAVAAIIAHAAPDILLLQSLDWDHDGATLSAFQDLLAKAGHPLPHAYAPRPNRGMATGLDLDGDGYRGDAEDAQGFGRFTGQGGMALLARFAFDRKAARDFSALLWRDLPGASLPVHDDGRPFPSPEALSVQRLSSTGHWVVPVILPDDSRLTLMAWHAGPPVFDGPEDRNGLRNGDETRLWLRLLDGQMGPVPQTPFVVLGNANLDPVRGEGRQQAIRDLLGDARLHDPFDGHPPTVDWSERGPGKLRVSYVLPSADLQVRDAGIIWPQDGPLHDTARTASRHRLVWVDIAR